MIRTKCLFWAAASLILLSYGLAMGADMEIPNHVAVYYFHGNFRCVNCRNIERYTKEAVEKYFQKELNSGKIVFKVINVERKGNEHFADDYKLYTKSVILSLVKDGKEVRFDNLSKVWEHLNNRNNFHDYIRTEVEKYLKEF